MRKIKTMDKILIFIAICVLAFTVTMIWLFKTTGYVPDTLITCFFVATTGECGVMGYIKANKDKTQARQWQLEDEIRQRKYLKEDMNYDRSNR